MGLLIIRHTAGLRKSCLSTDESNAVILAGISKVVKRTAFYSKIITDRIMNYSSVCI